MAVERGQSRSDALLRGKAVNTLSAPDRNLATALVLGVLRWQILLDRQLKSFLNRPGARLDAEIRIALRMGAFQLLHLDRIPPRAAIDESVELAKLAGHHFASRMVNAVLRKLTGSSDAMRAEPLEENAAELALAQAHPVWMVERWANFYGLEAARANCHHGQTQPALTVRIKGCDTEAELAQARITLEPAELLTAARKVVAGDVTATAAFREGRVRLQDEGSQLVGEIAGAGNPASVQAILDACAAPGGKTLILGERNPGAQIVACDSSPDRLAQMRSRFAAYQERIECRLADAAMLKEEAVFDIALADVPCSGTGTLGRNPEIRHRLRIADLARQAERQRAILSAALRAVRPGGRVVYSTCSLEPEENQQVVAAVVAEGAEARLVSLETSIHALLDTNVVTGSGANRLRASLTPEGAIRLLPGVFNSDGFYIAMLEKV